jgi:hypothetical protein
MVSFVKMLLIVLPLVIITSAQHVRAQNAINLKIESIEEVDICNEDKRVIVVVSLGEILKSDSLLYFDIELKFDPSKIQFDQILSTGTLSEQFASDMPATGIFTRYGYVGAYAGSFHDIPAYGAKPLIAFLGRAKVECPDSIEISLSDLDIELKRAIVDTQSAVVVAREGQLSTRKLQLLAEQDTLKFKDISNEQQLRLSIIGSKGIKLTEGILKVDYNESLFKISAIETLSDSVEIKENVSYGTGNTIVLNFRDTLKSNSEEIIITFESLTDTSVTEDIFAEITRVNDCSCVSIINEKVKITAVLEKKITSSIDKGDSESQNIELVNSSEKWILKTHGEYEAELYTVSGKYIARFSTNENIIVINKEELSWGCYIIVLTDKKNNKKQILKINK